MGTKDAKHPCDRQDTPSAQADTPVDESNKEWFATRKGLGRPGLRFKCTSCGNCCSGPSGFVLFTEAEGAKLAKRLGLSERAFYETYTKATVKGVSLAERPTDHGYDCVFLDRESVPGKAICSVYEDRPEQCRTWPFWKSNLESPDAWRRAKQICPGLDSGTLIPPDQIRIFRDRVDI